MRSDTQKASIQEKRNLLIRQIKRWRQPQLIYMPGAAALSPLTHETETDDNDINDLEPPEQIPLILPSAVEPARRNDICLHRVSEYEKQLRLAQLQDSLVELRRIRQIRYSLLMNHRTQIYGQGQSANTRSRTVIAGIEDRIAKFVQRYRTAYCALLQLDPIGDWRETYLELKAEDNRGPGKEDHEQRLGDGSYTLLWIWLLNPRARDSGGSGEPNASDEEVNDVMRVQWTTSHARMERWTEEVELLQEEMRRVVTFLEWKAGHWLRKQDMRSTRATPSVQSGLRAYARKQAAIYRGLAVSFSRMWRPTLISHNLEHSWLTQCMKEHGISSTDTNTPSEADGGFPTATTSHVPSQDPSSVSVADTPILLEEADYSDEDEDDYLMDSDTSFPDLDGYDDEDEDFRSGSDNDSHDVGNVFDESDFDFD